jgi:hypothetical protein
VVVRTPRKTLDLSDHSRLSWVSQEPAESYPANLPELPEWWTKPPDRKAPAVQKALRSLLDWSHQLREPNAGPPTSKAPANEESVVMKIKTQVKEVKDPDNQDVGILFLAALDQLEPLVGFLEDRQSANFRGVTLFALQSWLCRSSRHDGELAHL